MVDFLYAIRVMRKTIDPWAKWNATAKEPQISQMSPIAELVVIRPTIDLPLFHLRNLRNLRCCFLGPFDAREQRDSSRQLVMDGD